MKRKWKWLPTWWRTLPKGPLSYGSICAEMGAEGFPVVRQLAVAGPDPLESRDEEIAVRCLEAEMDNGENFVGMEFLHLIDKKIQSAFSRVQETVRIVLKTGTATTQDVIVNLGQLTRGFRATLDTLNQRRLRSSSEAGSAARRGAGLEHLGPLVRYCPRPAAIFLRALIMLFVATYFYAKGGGTIMSDFFMRLGVPGVCVIVVGGAFISLLSLPMVGVSVKRIRESIGNFLTRKLQEFVFEAGATLYRPLYHRLQSELQRLQHLHNLIWKKYDHLKNSRPDPYADFSRFNVAPQENQQVSIRNDLIPLQKHLPNCFEPINHDSDEREFLGIPIQPEVWVDAAIEEARRQVESSLENHRDEVEPILAEKQGDELKRICYQILDRAVPWLSVEKTRRANHWFFSSGNRSTLEKTMVAQSQRASSCSWSDPFRQLLIQTTPMVCLSNGFDHLRRDQLVSSTQLLIRENLSATAILDDVIDFMKEQFHLEMDVRVDGDIHSEEDGISQSVTPAEIDCDHLLSALTQVFEHHGCSLIESYFHLDDQSLQQQLDRLERAFEQLRTLAEEPADHSSDSQVRRVLEALIPYDEFVLRCGAGDINSDVEDELRQFQSMIDQLLEAHEITPVMPPVGVAYDHESEGSLVTAVLRRGYCRRISVEEEHPEYFIEPVVETTTQQNDEN